MMVANFRRWRQARQQKAEQRRYERHRNDALFRASNGERLPRREREEFDLPDWTGDY